MSSSQRSSRTFRFFESKAVPRRGFVSVSFLYFLARDVIKVCFSIWDLCKLIDHFLNLWLIKFDP